MSERLSSAYRDSTEAMDAVEQEGSTAGGSISLDDSTWDNQLQSVAADVQSALNRLDDHHENAPNYVLIVRNALI